MDLSETEEFLDGLPSLRGLTPFKVILWPLDPRERYEVVQALGIIQIAEENQYGEMEPVYYLRVPKSGGIGWRRIGSHQLKSAEILSPQASYPMMTRAIQLDSTLEEDVFRVGKDGELENPGPPTMEIYLHPSEKKAAVVWAARHAGYDPDPRSVHVTE